MLLNDPINQELHDSYSRDFNRVLLNKEGLGNIITFNVKASLVRSKSDIWSQIPFCHPNHDVTPKKITALPLLQNIQGDKNSKEFSFKLFIKDIFMAEFERTPKTEKNLQII